MPHLVNPIAKATFADALQRLRVAHDYLVERAKVTLATTSIEDARWGAMMKRELVQLNVGDVPQSIGKTSECLGEVINMAATLERLMDAIQWFSMQPSTSNGLIFECHPTTSDEDDGNDLVIIDEDGQKVARCEACDVVSSKASTNGKEKSDIENLGCDEDVPQDGIARYICTSREFADALSNPRRRWKRKHYRYRVIETGSVAETRLLLIQPRP